MSRQLQILGVMLFVVGVMASCASPPQTHQLEKTRIYSSDFDTTWSRIVQLLTMSQIPLKTIEKASGVIYAEKRYVVSNDIADCGNSGVLRVYGTYIDFNIYARKIDQGTSVTINTKFTQERQDDRLLNNHGAVIIDCSSTGVFEKMIFDGLQ